MQISTHALFESNLKYTISHFRNTVLCKLTVLPCTLLGARNEAIEMLPQLWHLTVSLSRGDINRNVGLTADHLSSMVVHWWVICPRSARVTFEQEGKLWPPNLLFRFCDFSMYALMHRTDTDRTILCLYGPGYTGG